MSGTQPSYAEPSYADYVNYYNGTQSQLFYSIKPQLSISGESQSRQKSNKHVCAILDKLVGEESRSQAQSRYGSSRGKVGKSGKKKVSGAMKRLMGAHKRYLLKSRKLREEAARMKAVQPKEPTLQKNELIKKRKRHVLRLCRPPPKLTKSQKMAKSKILADARKLMKAQHVSNKPTCTKKRKRRADEVQVCKKQRM